MNEERPLPINDEETPDVVGDSLDDLIGTWSDDDERLILDAVEQFERIDQAFWS